MEGNNCMFSPSPLAHAPGLIGLWLWQHLAKQHPRSMCQTRNVRFSFCPVLPSPFREARDDVIILHSCSKPSHKELGF